LSLEEVFSNVLLMFLCYAYVLAIIVISGKMDKNSVFHGRAHGSSYGRL
jgi:hypothetical protein